MQKAFKFGQRWCRWLGTHTDHVPFGHGGSGMRRACMLVVYWGGSRLARMESVRRGMRCFPKHDALLGRLARAIAPAGGEQSNV